MFTTAPEKNYGMLTGLTCKITLLDSPHPVIVSKNPGFWALYIARHNEFRFFRSISTIFSFLAAGFCPKNLDFARKIMVLLESGGLQPPPALWLVRLCFISFGAKDLDILRPI